MAQEWVLATRSILATLGALVYFYVGFTLNKREVATEARFALRGFVSWWYGIGAIGIIGVIWSITLTAVQPPKLVVLGYYYLAIGVISLICFGLLVYLLYLYTGRRRIRVFLGMFYLAFFLVFLYWIHGFGGVCLLPDEAGPGCVEPDGWDGESLAIGSGEAKPAWFGSMLGLLLIVPLFGGAVAYAMLYFRVETRTQKYRVGVVSLAFLFWFGSSFANTLIGLGGDGGGYVWSLISPHIGLTAALMVVFAYQPPVWLQKRFHIAAVLSED